MAKFNTVKYFSIKNRGETEIWKPAFGENVIIYNIAIYGFCKATYSKPFYFDIKIKENNEWKSLCGVKAIDTKDFEISKEYRLGIKTNKGEGTSLIKAIASGGKGSFDVSVSIVGVEYKEN